MMSVCLSPEKGRRSRRETLPPSMVGGVSTKETSTSGSNESKSDVKSKGDMG